jgi:DNA primase
VQKPAEYRRMAERCEELAKNISLSPEREEMRQKAKQWVAIAERLEAEEAASKLDQ